MHPLALLFFGSLRLGQDPRLACQSFVRRTEGPGIRFPIEMLLRSVAFAKIQHVSFSSTGISVAVNPPLRSPVSSRLKSAAIELPALCCPHEDQLPFEIARTVFDENGRVQRSVNQPFQQTIVHRGNAQRHITFGTFCARFHGSMRL